MKDITNVLWFGEDGLQDNMDKFIEMRWGYLFNAFKCVVVNRIQILASLNNIINKVIPAQKRSMELANELVMKMDTYFFVKVSVLLDLFDDLQNNLNQTKLNNLNSITNNIIEWKTIIVSENI